MKHVLILIILIIATNSCKQESDTSQNGLSSREVSIKVSQAKRQDSLNSAIKEYSKVIELGSKNDTTYNNRGFCKSELENYTGAIEDYTKAIELNPKYALVYKKRSDCKLNLHDWKGALDDQKKAAELGYKDKETQN